MHNLRKGKPKPSKQVCEFSLSSMPFRVSKNIREADGWEYLTLDEIREEIRTKYPDVQSFIDEWKEESNKRGYKRALNRPALRQTKSDG